MIIKLARVSLYVIGLQSRAEMQSVKSQANPSRDEKYT